MKTLSARHVLSSDRGWPEPERHEDPERGENPEREVDREQPDLECQEDPELREDLEIELGGGIVSQYILVDRAIINIQTGQVDLKTGLGRAWVGQVFVLVVMSLLQPLHNGHDSGRHAKIMRGKDNKVKAYLV